MIYKIYHRPDPEMNGIKQRGAEYNEHNLASELGHLLNQITTEDLEFSVHNQLIERLSKFLLNIQLIFPSFKCGFL